MGAFLSGLMGPITQKLETRHAEEETAKEKRRQDLWKVIQSPEGTFSDETRQQAWSDLQKISNPEARKGIGKFKEIFEKLKPPTQAQAQPQQPSPQGKLQPPAQAQPAQGELHPIGGQPQSSGPLQPPAPIAAPTIGIMTSAQRTEQAMAREKEVYDAWLKRGKEVLGPTADPRDLAEYAGSKGTKLPARATVAARRAERWKVGDAELDVDFDPKTGTRYDPQGEIWDVPEGAQRVASKTSIARPTIIASDYVNLDDAKALKESGAPFLGADGKELDITKIPKGMVLQKIHFADGRTLYEPRNINDKVVKFNNQVFAVNPSQVQNIPQGAGVSLGQANTGAVSTHEVMAQDAAGNPVAQQLVSTRTPLTPGVPGRAAPPAVTAPAGSAPVPVAPAATPGGRSRLTPPAGGGVRIVAGMTPGQAEHVTQRAIPVREAATQLFGDPGNPEIKGLMDFSKLADDPKARERLGKAFKLTLDWMEHGSSGGHVRADAGPVSVAIASPMEWIENYFNMPANIASQRAGIMQKAMQDLTPEEREAYNATMASFGTIVGLRSLSRASASQASVQTIEREMPIIGVNTADSSQFADQMARLAEIINNGSRDKSIQAVMKAQTPGLLERIQGLPAEAKKLKDLARKPSPNGKLRPPAAAPKTAAEYLESIKKK